MIDIGLQVLGKMEDKLLRQGRLWEVSKQKDSITGQYLSGEKIIHLPAERRQDNQGVIQITGASENNLKNIDVEIPQDNLY